MFDDAIVKRPPGRPSLYTAEIADEICERLAAGEGLNAICKDQHMPTEKAVRLWVDEDRDGFSPRYVRAREMQAEHWASEIVQIADSVRQGATSEEVNAARLAVDARKWIASKILPKRYGDRMTVEGNPDQPLIPTRIELVAVAPSAPEPAKDAE